MSSEILDQSAVDALLQAVDTGEVEAPQEQGRIFTRHRHDGEIEVRTYDFKRPERVSKDQMRALQTLHEAFARNFGASLSGYLRTIVEVKVATCEQMTYAEFISSLPNPTSFNLIHADALEGQMCLEVSPLIIYPIIDRLLGGTTQDLFIPQRPMTMIESRLISNVTARGLSALGEAWESIRKMEFKISSTESNPQLVQIVPPNEVVVVIGFELRMSNRAGTMSLCIPYNAIEPVMDELAAQSWFSSHRQGKSSEHGEKIAVNLGRSGVIIRGELARTKIKLVDLLSLEPGDLIMTERKAAAPLVVSVQGERKFVARVGQYKGARALRIERSVRAEDRV